MAPSFYGSLGEGVILLLAWEFVLARANDSYALLHEFLDPFYQGLVIRGLLPF